MTNMPFVINPEKGYFMTANHRVVPETARLDVGASMISTGRSLRLIEIIEDNIKRGKKMSRQDMVDMQMDFVDVIARELSKHIVNVAQKTVSDASFGFSSDEQYTIEDMIEIMR